MPRAPPVMTAARPFKSIWFMVSGAGKVVRPVHVRSDGRRSQGSPLVHRRSSVTMVVVIFEVRPAAGRRQEYLDLAASLRAELEQIDGFISVERFESLHEPGKILSLSCWRDEEAVAAWRQVEAHRRAQWRGRKE